MEWADFFDRFGLVRTGRTGSERTQYRWDTEAAPSCCLHSFDNPGCVDANETKADRSY